MDKSKVTLLFFALVILILVIVVFQIKNSPNQIQPQSSPLPRASVQASFTPTPTSFSIISSEIPDPKQDKLAVKVKFNQSVDLNSLNVQVTPPTTVYNKINTDSTEVTISPANYWIPNTSYTISIPQSTKSKSGINLDKTYTFTFKTAGYTGI